MRLVALISAVLFLSLSSARADWKTTYEDAKKDVTEKFEAFKKDGLTAAQAKELTDKLLDVAGDKIEGTGTETLLKTLNKQAERVDWLATKKETIEQLIDFVGDVYALGSSDVPPDGVAAYKSLTKGVQLAADFAGEVPVIGQVAGPMISAYAQAMKNGESHVEAISDATKAKNKAIALGWRSMQDEDMLAVADIDTLEPEEVLTKEDQLLAKWEAEQRAENEKCRERCASQAAAYDRAASARPAALKALNDAKTALDDAVRVMKQRRLQYNIAVDQNKKAYAVLESNIAKRNSLLPELDRAKAAGNQAAVKELLRIIKQRDRDLDKSRQRLRQSYRKASDLFLVYLNARSRVGPLLSTYRAAKADYDSKHAVFLKAKAAYETCMKSCLEGVSEKCATKIEIAASGSRFPSLPTTNPASFGFQGDVRGVNFDGYAAGRLLTTEYAGVGVTMNSIRIDSSVYEGPASAPNATEHNQPQIFTFSVPVVAAGIINTSPDQDVVEAWSGPNGTGTLLLRFRDQEGTTMNYHVDRFVGVRSCASSPIGSFKVYNNSGDLELDELIFEVAPK